jgi:hypothetical protein
MTATLKTIDADGIAADALGLERMAPTGGGAPKHGFGCSITIRQ